MRLLLSYVALAVTMVQMGHALPQPQASQDGEAVGHIVVLKAGLTENHLNEHLDAVKGIQKRSKSNGTSESGVKHVVDGASYGFQGYTGVFTPETLEFIKAHEHVDYVEEDVNLSELPVETREVSDTEPSVEGESADTDATNVPAVSTGGPNMRKSTTGGTLSEGQGYNTFLGKGLLLDNVIFPSEAVAKRDALPAGEDNPETAFNFTAPSANLSGIVVDEYFARPKHRTRPHSLAELKKHSNSTLPAVHSNFTLPAVQRRTTDVRKCNAKIKTHYEFVEDYGHYLQALDVSASLTIAGWGQSASLSGTYLDQAKMSHDSITFVATIDIENDQKFPNGRFNLANYKKEDFTKTHGDRWVRGYSRGGRLSARLIFTTSEEHDKEELKASAHAALRFWGISTDIDAEVKKAIEEVNKHTKVDVSLFQKGNLGKFRENKLIDKKALESVSASFAQLKEWADEFMEQACDHEFAFQPVLDEYTILPDFPQSQEIPDMDLLRLYANDLLQALVKAWELSAALEREFETGGYPNFPKGRKGVRAMKKQFRGLVRESQKWISQASIKVNSAENDEEKVEDDIWVFIDHYKPLLQQAMAKNESSR